MGDDEFVATDRPFQSMKAVERTRAKLRAWVRVCRAEEREDAREGNMLAILCSVRYCFSFFCVGV